MSGSRLAKCFTVVRWQFASRLWTPEGSRYTPATAWGSCWWPTRRTTTHVWTRMGPLALDRFPPFHAPELPKRSFPSICAIPDDFTLCMSSSLWNLWHHLFSSLQLMSSSGSLSRIVKVAELDFIPKSDCEIPVHRPISRVWKNNPEGGLASFKYAITPRFGMAYALGSLPRRSAGGGGCPCRLPALIVSLFLIFLTFLLALIRVPFVSQHLKFLSVPVAGPPEGGHFGGFSGDRRLNATLHISKFILHPHADFSKILAPPLPFDTVWVSELCAVRDSVFSFCSPISSGLAKLCFSLTAYLPIAFLGFRNLSRSNPSERDIHLLSWLGFTQSSYLKHFGLA